MSSSDLEKNALDVSEKDVAVGYAEPAAAHDVSLYGRIQTFANSYAMEARGVERVPEDERTDTSLLRPGFFFFSINMVVTCLSTGALGPQVGLQFWDSLCVIVFFTALGTLPVAWFSLFGPKLGFRQMLLGRYWFGFYGAKIFTFLNLISCVGWSAISTIVGAQMLHTVAADHNVPPWAGVLMITIMAFVLTLFGYRVVHTYEKYSWLPTLIIMFVIIARLKMSGAFTTGTLATGTIEAGSVLTFGSVIFGGAAGWTTFATDYVVYQPKNTNLYKLFAVVFFSIYVPIVFVELIGLSCFMGTFTSERFAQGYNDNSMGGLLYAILVQDSLHGFGSFCLVILALSTVGGTCPNNYSFGLSIQALAGIFNKIPRIIWAIISSGLFIAVSIPAYYSFEEYMEDFMGIMGYWVTSYISIATIEHLLIRRGFGGYNFDDYNDPSKLPPGYSTLFAFLVGVGAMVVGMSQTWWTGPLATLAKGDIGFEITLGFSALAYVLARPLEYKYFGR
ncbi:permease for cytosine/purines, uracil, thiamine, allantoin-domain-containing protein [Dipodascopsis tothii]|uniref:permease for cytosine/purines, uracil, thiamine, allantoin-domain-containing protein n=1 Tax=Dipodascopsis tothii TaxID=44089 RepID=UPI0034CDE924